MPVKKEDITKVLQRTNKENPNPSDIEIMRKELDARPELVRSIGNTSKYVFDSILKRAVTSVLVRESSERFMTQMKTELGYETSTFVEKMLIDEIIVRWLRLQTVENQHHDQVKGSHTIAVGTYWDKRLNAEHHRYLRSIETLAKVRKMIAQTQAKGAKMFKDLMTAKE